MSADLTWLLDDVAAARVRDDVVPLYATLIWVMNDGEIAFDAPIIRAVNDRIIEKWSKSGLTYIKTKAWRLQR